MRMIWAGIVVSFILLASCIPTGPYSLPLSWPIPELTLPAGATIPEPCIRRSGGEGISYWQLEFSGSQTTQAVVDHVEDCLKQAGYSKLTTGSEPDLSTNMPVMLVYYSPDRKTKVLLTLAIGTLHRIMVYTTTSEFSEMTAIDADPGQQLTLLR